MFTRIVFLIVLFLSNFLFVKGQISTTEMEILNFPEVLKESENEINSVLAFKIESMIYDGFHLENKVKADAMKFTHVMSPSDFYFNSKVGRWNRYQSIDKCFYLEKNEFKSHLEKGEIFISFNGKKYQMRGLVNMITVKLRNPKLIPKKVKVLKLKQEFIYSGKIGNSIKFIYREFIDNLARPSFTQDIQYDLDESSIVGFKGLKIEVISATNSLIKYKIISPFN